MAALRLITTITVPHTILPAGFGHKRLEASDDFQVIGVYPNGQNYDFCYGYADERPEKLENIKQVPLPGDDLLFGRNHGSVKVRIYSRISEGTEIAPIFMTLEACCYTPKAGYL
ncbi:hypothetical protein SAMN04488123_102233, partial [Natribacillus halophilus]